MRHRIRLAASILSMPLALAACVGTDEQIRILQEYNSIAATPSTAPGYDYTVVIKNLSPLGVSMETRLDRERLAVAYLGERCSDGKVVSETELASSTPGLQVRSKDYAVRLKC